MPGWVVALIVYMIFSSVICGIAASKGEDALFVAICLLVFLAVVLAITGAFLKGVIFLIEKIYELILVIIHYIAQ